MESYTVVLCLAAFTQNNDFENYPFCFWVISHYEYSTLYLSIYLVKDIWIVSLLAVNKAAVNILYKCLYGHRVFLLGKKLGAEWLDHICSLFKILLKVVQGQIITWKAYFVVLLLSKVMG